jgi:hypothetical protein
VRGGVADLESGFVVVDFGSSSDWRALVAGLTKHAKRPGGQPLVVILQSPMIAALRSTGEIDAFFEYWRRARQTGIQAVWVLPQQAGTDRPAIALIKGAGFGVHASGADQACFIEVHKPDGSITIGMAGEAL